MSLAIVPGSFDPFTLGHRAIVESALSDFDEVVVALMVNAEKEYRFPLSERMAFAKASLADLPRVRVIFDGGLLVDLYRRLGADAVCKGIRNETDRAYEEKMDEWNRERCEGFRSVFYEALPGLVEVSSTKARERLEESPDGLEGLLHPSVIALLKEKQGNPGKGKA